MGTFCSFSTAPISIYDSDKKGKVVRLLDDLHKMGAIREYRYIQFDKLAVYIGIAKCLAWELSIHFTNDVQVCIMDEESNSFSTFDNIN